MKEEHFKLPVPENEVERIKALHEYNLLDSMAEEQFDRLTKLASFICEAPIALISLVDSNRQWFKSKIGLDVAETAREIAFCQYTIMTDDFFEVEDAILDERFKKNPLVTSEPKIRFYAGYPLIDPQGYALGSLCVIDQLPKKLTDNQKAALKTLSEDIMLQIVSNKKNEERRKLEQFFMMSMDMICITGMDGCFKKINPSFCQTLGWSEEELINKPFINFVHPDDVLSSIDEVKRLSQGYMTIDFINRYRTSNNTYKQLQWVCNPDTGTGELFAIARDITSRVELENDLRKSKSEIEKTAKIKEQFLANMSHEIRTPMNAIIGFSALLKETILSRKQAEFVNSINAASCNLLGIINDILDLSKIESGSMQIENTTMHLPALMESVHAIVLGNAIDKKLDISMSLGADVPAYVVSDPTRISQVLINLTTNAIKFTEQGFVNIRVEVDKKEKNNIYIKFVVHDSGIGIAKENQEIVFERFKQETAGTNRKYGGSGLGLSIVQNIVKLMGGEISVESELGKGSMFTVVIPVLACNDENISAYKKLNDEHVTTENAKPKMLNILLAEDNRMNQQYVSTIMEQNGYKFKIANNGSEAVKMLETMKFDMILMDIQMPVMDGYEAAKIIRNEMKMDIPILALTANATTSDYEKCLQCGMNGYISKPYKPNDLLKKIEDLMVKKYVNERSNMVLYSGIMNSTEKLVDLALLKEQVNGNLVAAKDLIQIFVEDSPQDLLKLSTAIEIEDYLTIAMLSHLLVTSFSILGITKAVNILKQMEHLGGLKKDINVISILYLELCEINEKVRTEICNMKSLV